MKLLALSLAVLMAASISTAQTIANKCAEDNCGWNNNPTVCDSDGFCHVDNDVNTNVKKKTTQVKPKDYTNTDGIVPGNLVITGIVTASTMTPTITMYTLGEKLLVYTDSSGKEALTVYFDGHVEAGDHEIVDSVSLLFWKTFSQRYWDIQKQSCSISYGSPITVPSDIKGAVDGAQLLISH